MATTTDTPNAADESTYSRGDYVVGNPHSGHEDVLFRVQNEWRTDEGDARVNLATTLTGEVDRVALPVEAVRPATVDGEGEHLAEYRAQADHRSPIRSGIRTLPADRQDEWCPACGCNTIHFSHDTLAGEGGEWCAACSYEFSR